MKFFMTHSWKDIDFARQLADDLRANGLEGFFDMYSIKPGQNIAERIARGLEECDVYVPILSLAALQSPWCREEINAAITLSNEPGRNGRPLIIPILIENCQDEMPVFLRSRLYINFTGRHAEALQELLTQGFGITAPPKAEKVPETMPPSPQLGSTAQATQPHMRRLPKWILPLFQGPITLFQSLKARASLPESMLWATTGALLGNLIYTNVRYHGFELTTVLPGIIVSMLAYLAVFWVWELVQYRLARAIGGKGNLVTQSYLHSISVGPFMIVVRVLGLGEALALFTNSGLVFLLIGLLLLYLLVLALQVAHDLTIDKAILTSIIPWLFGMIAFSFFHNWFFFLPSSS